MASSVCAFAVSPAPATSFISPPLYRTSRQWRCVYSARQQKEPVRRLRKGLARFVVVLADEESDVQLGISRKRPPIAKPTTPRHFSTASTQLRHLIAGGISQSGPSPLSVRLTLGAKPSFASMERLSPSLSFASPS